MSEENKVLETRIWLKSLLNEYYQKVEKLSIPPEISKREFGFGSLSKKVTVRHRAFTDAEELLSYLKREAPAHVNHSISRYAFPDNPDINSKVREATDLIFDIDVGDLKLKHPHDASWVCGDCFFALRQEAQKLLEFLTDDFGFQRKEVSVNFSGSRGYHLRVKNDKVLKVGEEGRKEICGYISLDMDLGTMIVEHGNLVYGPKIEHGGLRGRITRTVIKEVLSSDMPNKKHIAEQVKRGNWGAFPKFYGIKRIIAFAKKSAVKIPVDSKVTTDPSHMIRMPDTIHGGSMMLARTVDDLDSFDPLNSCFVFGDEDIPVEFIQKTPGIAAKGEDFGPFEKGETKLPKYLAAYFAAKGRCIVPR